MRKSRTYRFLHYFTAATIGLGLVFVAKILVVGSMPAQNQYSVILVNFSSLKPGTGMVIPYRGRPLAIRRLTPGELHIVRQNHHWYADKDSSLPKTVDPTRPDIVVAFPECVWSTARWVDNGHKHGIQWYCPSRGSHFDAYGRVVKGPDPDFRAPPWHFLDETTISVGRMNRSRMLAELDRKYLGFDMPDPE